MCGFMGIGVTDMGEEWDWSLVEVAAGDFPNKQERYVAQLEVYAPCLLISLYVQLRDCSGNGCDVNRRAHELHDVLGTSVGRIR